jgi:hypothetical protein
MERKASSDTQKENTIRFLHKRSHEHSNNTEAATRRAKSDENDLEPKKIPKENASAMAKRGFAISY